MKKKSFLSGIAILILLLGGIAMVFTGCGGGGKKTPDKYSITIIQPEDTDWGRFTVHLGNVNAAEVTGANCI